MLYYDGIAQKFWWLTVKCALIFYGLFVDLVSNIVCEFLEVAIHNVLYLRKLYPDAIFEPKRKYGVVVYYSRHPELNDYIIQCLKAASFHLKRNQLRSVFVCFHIDEQLVEKYNFDICEICDGFEGFYLNFFIGNCW